MLEDFPKVERVSIAVTGLPRAGKSAFILRAFRNKGNLGGLSTTLGIDVEVASRGGFTFQFFDLGGQQEFRYVLQESYIRMALAIIYVFDSTDHDPANLIENREWFWRVASEWVAEDCTIIFLANKWDLETERMELPEIIDKMNLKDYSKQYNRNFRIFTTSMKTGENVEAVLDYLVNQMRIKKIVERVQLHYLSVNLPIFSTNDVEIAFSKDKKIREVFINLKRSIIPENEEENLKYAQFGEYRLLMISNQDFICYLLINKDDSQYKAKIIANATLRYVKVLLDEKSPSNITKDELKLLISDFLKNNFLLATNDE